jgi:glycosyltransferase involved in cell wall biosynthesis
MWLNNQLIKMLLYKNSLIPLNLDKDLRDIISQSLIVIFLGACKVSVIIPTLNEEKYIKKCLRSLKEQDCKEEFEIIVVDGGSSDSTVNLAKSLADKIIIYEGKPVGDARNLGVKFAEAEKIAFIDADTMASKHWISRISKYLSCKGVIGVTGPTLPYKGTKLDKLAYRVATKWLQRFSMAFGIPHVAGFNCAYLREPFLKCGGFEEGMTLSEDLALSLKIKREGQIIYDKNMIAYTSPRRIRAYGYLRLAMFYLLNDAIFAITKRNLPYPPIR